MNARQFFDAWTISVVMVREARSAALPVALVRGGVASHLRAKHGERIAREGQAYFDKLLTDCQRMSAGEGA